MKFSLKTKNGEPLISLEYDSGEWRTIEKKLRELGLRSAKTEKGMGGSQKFDYLKNDNKNFITFLQMPKNAFDDINAPVISNNMVNVGIFRIIPIDGKVEIKLDRFLTVMETRALTSGISETLEKIFNVVTDKSFEFEITSTKMKVSELQ